MKLSKKAKTKIIVTVLAVCLAVFGAYKFVDTYSHSYAENKAINYLCQKYDEDASAFEVLDYRQAGIGFRDNGLIIGNIVWVNFAFEVKYNDKTFFVKKYKGEYYDDYQLEDIEKWCTDWLKNNVDERFTGFNLETDDIIWYLITEKRGNKYLITESNAEEILNCVPFREFNRYDYDSTVFYYDSSKESDTDNLDEELMKKLNDKLLLPSNSYCCEGTVKLFVSKSFDTDVPCFYESNRKYICRK